MTWAVLIEPGRLVVREIPLAIPRWPAAIGPLRIAAISDVHTGAPHITFDKLREVVARTNAAHPDLVVLLGDYVIHGVVGGRFVPPEPTAAVLRDLRAPLGVFAVLGNHDWWYDGARVGRAFTDAGIPVLDDEAVAVPTRGERAIQAGRPHPRGPGEPAAARTPHRAVGLRPAVRDRSRARGRP